MRCPPIIPLPRTRNGYKPVDLITARHHGTNPVTHGMRNDNNLGLGSRMWFHYRADCLKKKVDGCLSRWQICHTSILTIIESKIYLCLLLEFCEITPNSIEFRKYPCVAMHFRSNSCPIFFQICRVIEIFILSRQFSQADQNFFHFMV